MLCLSYAKWSTHATQVPHRYLADNRCNACKQDDQYQCGNASKPAAVSRNKYSLKQSLDLAAGRSFRH